MIQITNTRPNKDPKPQKYVKLVGHDESIRKSFTRLRYGLLFDIFNLRITYTNYYTTLYPPPSFVLFLFILLLIY
jgi:hypothetical protein